MTLTTTMSPLPGQGTDETFVEQDYKPEIEKFSPFDYINSINGHATNNMMRDTDDDANIEKQYVPWIVNLGLSNFPDTVLHANLMNEYHFLDHRPQYEFLLNSIRPRKRYAKWAKHTGDEDLDVICTTYNCNRKVARDYLALLSSDQIEALRQRQKVGGVEK